MQLEVGKTYITNCGDKVKIIGHNPYLINYCFIGQVTFKDGHQLDLSFTKDGLLIHKMSNSGDIIKEAEPEN